MNIFILDTNPIKAAKCLDDKRVVKMILETAQILCTVLNKCGVSNTPYKPTHVNHPCTLWAGKTRMNFQWLLSHGQALCSEYTNRYSKRHKSQDIIDWAAEFDELVPVGRLTEFINCTTYKNVSDTVKAYHMYMSDKYKQDKRVPTWYGIPLKKEDKEVMK